VIQKEDDFSQKLDLTFDLSNLKKLRTYSLEIRFGDNEWRLAERPFRYRRVAIKPDRPINEHISGHCLIQMQRTLDISANGPPSNVRLKLAPKLRKLPPNLFVADCQTDGVRPYLFQLCLVSAQKLKDNQATVMS